MKLRLKEVLSNRGITASKLCEMMEAADGPGLTKASISSIINEKSSPKVSTIQAIAKTLGVEITHLFEGGIPDNMKAIYEKLEDGTFEEIGYIKKPKEQTKTKDA